MAFAKRINPSKLIMLEKLLLFNNKTVSKTISSIVKIEIMHQENFNFLLKINLRKNIKNIGKKETLLIFKTLLQIIAIKEKVKEISGSKNNIPIIKVIKIGKIKNVCFRKTFNTIKKRIENNKIIKTIFSFLLVLIIYLFVLCIYNVFHQGKIKNRIKIWL